MQLLLLGMAAALFLYDDLFAGSGVRDAVSAEAEPATGFLWWAGFADDPRLWLPTMVTAKLVVFIAFAWRCRLTRSRLGKPSGFKGLAAIDRYFLALPFVLLALFVADLACGWLTLVRDVVGDRVLLDEAIAMTPTLLTVLGVWWLHYPIDRRLREATIMRRADEGLPVYPLLSRGRFVFNQARHQLGILLVPLLILMAWSESVQWFAETGRITATAALWITPIGAGTMFVLAPPLLTRVFDTVPLPAGSIRDAMLEVCAQHRVRVADLRLWRTGGHMINAAVMGLVPRLRYVLLSDGLLDQLHRPHVEAVMAHELGHVKHRHIVWLLMFAALLMGSSFAAADAVIARTSDAAWVQSLCIGVALLAWAWAFGWCSRRIERQADTFAAKHMSAVGGDEERFTPEGVSHVAAALGRVAELNHLRPTRPSWRHGSIAQRQDYLMSLVDRPQKQASVDRTMNRLKAAALAAVVTLVALNFWVG
ncbi:MAG: M48 family metallopeptidase [Planctomycetota bacterium]